MEVLFTPADYESLKPGTLANAVCVVFDVLRATSSMVTALSHGAVGIHPVGSIADAVRLKHLQPATLLAGERNGLRIRADATGGIDFDLGNSPREFTPSVVEDKSIIMTTTNGTRALQACHGANSTLICSFLNLKSTADYLSRVDAKSLLLICSGTGEQAAYEDVLCAGALVDLVSTGRRPQPLADSALMACRLYLHEQSDLEGALGRSSNGRRLLGLPDLRADVAYCAQRNRFGIVAGTTDDGPIATIRQ